MNVLFEQDGLEHLDQLGCEALILPFFDDERPPRGTLGLVDWRFAGLVSRLIQRGVVRGEAGATSLLPARRRLPSIDKIFVLGLGPVDGFDAKRFEEAVQAILDLARRVKLRTMGLSLPGRSLDRIAPVPAIEAFLRIAEPLIDEATAITILDRPDALRAMEPAVALVKRRMRARFDA